MSEWPKKAKMLVEGDGRSVQGRNELVIPADLGRELYEALKELHNTFYHGDEPQVETLLARYEREVGE